MNWIDYRAENQLTGLCGVGFLGNTGSRLSSLVGGKSEFDLFSVGIVRTTFWPDLSSQPATHQLKIRSELRLTMTRNNRNSPISFDLDKYWSYEDDTRLIMKGPTITIDWPCERLDKKQQHLHPVSSHGRIWRRDSLKSRWKAYRIYCLLPGTTDKVWPFPPTIQPRLIISLLGQSLQPIIIQQNQTFFSAIWNLEPRKQQWKWTHTTASS